MAGNYTFSIIKPVAVKSGQIGNILADILNEGYDILAMKFTRMTHSEAEIFYSIHKDKYFFGELVEFMSSGPIVAIIFSKENAVADYRNLIGATDPAEAAEGTIRKKYGHSIRQNAVHGSDSDENATLEASYFFSGFEQHWIYRE